MKPYYADDLVTLYHCDTLDILHDLTGVGAVVTDPPYSSGGAFRGDRTSSTISKYVQSGAEIGYRSEFSGDNRDQRGFFAWSTLWVNGCRRASVPGAVFLSFIDWRQLPTLTDAVQAGGWVWRGIGTWHKPGIRMQKGRFSASAEFVVYATNGPAPEHDGYAQNVFPCPPVREKEHIAEKPEPVLEWLLQVVPAGTTVLDPFVGSGTTLRVARRLGFKVIGCEVDEACCESAAQWLATGRPRRARTADQGALGLG